MEIRPEEAFALRATYMNTKHEEKEIIGQTIAPSITRSYCGAHYSKVSLAGCYYNFSSYDHASKYFLQKCSSAVRRTVIPCYGGQRTLPLDTEDHLLSVFRGDITLITP